MPYKSSREDGLKRRIIRPYIILLYRRVTGAAAAAFQTASFASVDLVIIIYTYICVCTRIIIIYARVCARARVLYRHTFVHNFAELICIITPFRICAHNYVHGRCLFIFIFSPWCMRRILRPCTSLCICSCGAAICLSLRRPWIINDLVTLARTVKSTCKRFHRTYLYV